MKTVIFLNMATLCGLLFAASEWWHTAAIVAGLGFYLFWWEELNAQELYELRERLLVKEINRYREFTRCDFEG